jgi:hypothetical protein
MTRLSTATPHGKKHVPHIGKRRRQHMKSDDDWQRKPAMPAYCRPKHPKLDLSFVADELDDMDMAAPHDA